MAGDHTGMTTAQRQHFDQEGYLTLRAAAPPALLSRLQDMTARMMADPTAPGRQTHVIGDREYVCNIANICQCDDLSALEWLGGPSVEAWATAICGADFFAVQDYVVIKNIGDPSTILWHRDMMHQRTGDCFFLGLYLDDANAGDGALQVVPGSHLSPKHICEIRKEPNVALPMLAGDILLHDLMLAHCSGAMTQNPLRRVLYIELISARQAREEQLFSEELIESRLYLQTLARQFYRDRQEGALAQTEVLVGLRSALNDIYTVTIRNWPSSYCLELD